MSVTAKCLLQTAYANTSLTTVYTAPASTRTIIDKFTATNNDSGAVTLSVHLVASTGTADASNIVIKTLSIAAGATEDLSELQNHILNAGDFISCVASAASMLVIRASGREIT